MNLKAGLRDLHNQQQELIGNEYGADGVEISVHANPAEDHQLAQGRQFTNEQYELLQKDGIATDYTGKEINLHRENKNGSQAIAFRPISEYNCYHYIFKIILGVNKSNYTEEKLQEIIDKNDKGFEFEGKHYSMYEGTQLQRRLETEIRKQKDSQILARASDNEELAQYSQNKINQLIDKYKELNEASGLKPKADRLRVSGYHKIKVNEP